MTDSGILKRMPHDVGGETTGGYLNMTEKVKKTKVAAKPRAVAGTTKKVAATKETVIEKVTRTTPTHTEIALLALQYWAERGRQHGQDQADWLRAEQELMELAS